jgi:hypothetical protein
MKFFRNGEQPAWWISLIPFLVLVAVLSIVIFVFKTDALSPEEIRKRYSSQLNTYRRALELLKPGIPIHTYAWSFHNGAAISI